MLIVIHPTTIASQTAVVAQAAVPILPILLLPFILIFFLIIFPLWMVSLGVLGLVLLVLRGAAWLAHRGEPGALDAPTAAVHRAFRWVLTFAGFTERGKEPAK